MSSTIPAELLGIKDRFETWRANRKYVREPIPDELRNAAAALSRRYPPSPVGRVLKIDPSRLKKLLIKRPARHSTRKKPQVFVFRNRRGAALKMLCYDGIGFYLFTRRFSQGHIRWWPEDQDAPLHPLEARQLSILLYNGLPEQAGFASQW
jgi:hypothetical protein